jgi:hypothetical protein
VLDDDVLLPVLDRVYRGTITVRHDEYHREWYSEEGRQCLFATDLLRVLVELDYAYWDGYVEENGRLLARQDGTWTIKLSDKGHELLKRLTEGPQVLTSESAPRSGG